MMSGKRKMSWKRSLAGVLSAVMMLSAIQLPEEIAYAAETAVSVQEDEGHGEAAGTEDEAQEQGNGSGVDEGEEPSDTGEEAEASDTEPQEPADGEHDAADTEPQESGDGEDSLGTETQEPADGENPSGDDDTADEEAEDETDAPDTNEVRVSGISDNDADSPDSQEKWMEAELDGAYQFGGAPAAKGNLSAYTVSVYSIEAEKYLYQQILKRSEIIDISAYKLDLEGTKNLVYGVLNEHPDLYFVERGFSYYPGEYISKVMLTYNDTYDDAAFRKGVSSALACVDSQMSDLEKAVVLHDYLTVNCEYDYENLNANTIPDASYSAYGVFAERIAVCQGYALAYKYLLNQVGIDCYMVTSDKMNHAWNMIVLDGQYYQVDVTWDDPVRDKIGRSVHTYMFCSDAVFQDAEHGHYGWRVTNGSSVVDYQATDTRYDEAFWTDCDSPLVLVGDDCYYVTFDWAARQAVLKKGTLDNITDAGTAVQNIGSWPSGDNRYWACAFSGLFRIGDRLYYNDWSSIYSIALDGSGREKVFTVDTSAGYIYGSAYCQGKVLYALNRSLELKEKDIVLTADIDVGGGEPEVPDDPPEDDKALDLDNLSYEYTALDETTITSAAEGRPKLLVFYSNTCGNCSGTIQNLSSSIDSFAGIDIYAIETTQKTKEEVVAYQKQYGCEEITFSYDTTKRNENSMWAYARVAGIGVTGSGTRVTWPVICYIDADNRLQYVTTGWYAAADILSNLKLYTDWTLSASIRRPDQTTYKTGQRLNLTGGKVTYPSGDKMVTIDMKADMVSGFDSSKPGICSLTVTCRGYTMGFDVLIVEEPVLAASYGQKLKELTFPSNNYGSYFWAAEVDTEQELAQVGEQTFAAVFTPNEEARFSRMTDLQVRVTTKRTLDDAFQVVFKNKSFTYTGIGQEPKVIVSASGGALTGGTEVVLTEGLDYELTYVNNTDAGTAAVVVTGINVYQGSISKEFEIKPAQLLITARDMNILTGDPVPAANTYEYTVSGLMADDTLLTEPSFTCGIINSTTAGCYDIVPSGADAGSNYTISYVSGRLTVASEAYVCTVRFDVQGHGIAPAELIDVKVGSTIGRPADPEAAGYRFDGWYLDRACTKIWKFDTDIVQSDMALYAKWLDVSEESAFAIQEIADVFYTGKACKPAVSVYDGDTLLKSGRDYQIKYYNNINANAGGVLKQGNGEGAYFNAQLPYVEIIGKGNYTDRIKDGNKDTVKVNFNILRAAIGDGGSQAADGIVLKISDQLATAKKAQKPFTSIKYVKGMKRNTDFKLHLTVENARDQAGRSLQKDEELPDAVVPAGCSGEFLLTVEGIGNYEGSICRAVYVTDKTHLMKNATITIGKNRKNVVFTGKPVTLQPAEESSADNFVVKYGKTVLKPGRDYTVSYHNNDRVGKAELTITGTGEYAGSKTAAFNIKGKAFNAKTVLAEGIENQSYTGRAITQNGAALTYHTGDGASQPLRYGRDYTISYVKNINKGTATMTFKGVAAAGYSGSFKKTFKITAADIAQADRAAAMEHMVYDYCKAGVKPVEEISLTNQKGITLINGKDYTLKYVNNKTVASVSDANPPTVIVKGKGNYTGEFSVYFDIIRTDLRADSIQIKTTPAAYKANKAPEYAYKPAVKLMDGKSALRAGKDYMIEYRNNTQADYDSYIQKLRGQGRAGGSAPQESEATVDAGAPVAVITEAAGSSYRLDQPIIVPLPIYLNKLTKATLKVYVDEAVYSGSQVTPKVEVFYGGGLIHEGEDYTLSYGKNVASGKNKGSVVINGVAPYYGGSVTVKFDIVKKPITY